MANAEDLPTFGRYKILNLLGKGGTARVYRAVRSGQMGFGKEVALKVIDPEATADEEAALSLINEARLGGLLRHRNIVQIDDFEQVDGTFYIAMEFIDGWPLEKILTVLKNRKKMLPPTIVLTVMQDICRGLDYAHNRADRDGKSLHIVHRDLKPGNVMISRAGEVKIADFGTAKAATNIKKTAVGYTRGTPAYMSPEQVAGEPLDHRSDLFALGAILYELVTLKMAFPGDNMFAVMRKVLDGDTGDAQAKMAEISPDLARIMGRCMAPAMDDRYANAREIADDLAEVARTLKPGPPLLKWVGEVMAETPSTRTGEFGGDFVHNLRAAAAQPVAPEVDVQAETVQPEQEFEAPSEISAIESGSMAPLEGDFADLFAPSPDYSMDFDLSPSNLPGDPGVGALAPEPPPPVELSPPQADPAPLQEPPRAPLADLPVDFSMQSEAPPPDSTGERPGPSAAPRRVASGPGSKGPSAFDAGKFSLANSGPGEPTPRRERPPPRAAADSPPTRTAESSRSWQKSLKRRKQRDLVVQILVMAALAGVGLWMFGAPGGFEQRKAEVLRAVQSLTGGAGGEDVRAEFVDIPAGSIVLGQKGEQNAGESRHPIAVPSFSIMKYEVTVQQYRQGCPQRALGLGCRDWEGPEPWQQANHPVVRIPWEDAHDFCAGQGWALPTEAQWELAARGPERRKFPWGDTMIMKAMNYCDRGCDEAGLPHTNEDDRFPHTSPVGHFRAGATPEGVHDLSGNASEWVEDCWVQNHLNRADWTAPEVDDCKTRAVRGGSWKETVLAQAAYRRTPAAASTRSEKIGFRCVKNAAP